MNRRDALVAIAGTAGAIGGAQSLGVNPLGLIRHDAPEARANELEVIRTSHETRDHRGGDLDLHASAAVRNVGTREYRVAADMTPVMTNGETLRERRVYEVLKPDGEWAFEAEWSKLDDGDANNVESINLTLNTCTHDWPWPPCNEVTTYDG